MHSSRPPPERSDKALRAAIRVLVGDERTRLGNRSPAITDRDKAPAGRAEAAAACAPRRDQGAGMWALLPLWGTAPQTCARMHGSAKLPRAGSRNPTKPTKPTNEAASVGAGQPRARRPIGFKIAVTSLHHDQLELEKRLDGHYRSDQLLVTDQLPRRGDEFGLAVKQRRFGGIPRLRLRKRWWRRYVALKDTGELVLLSLRSLPAAARTVPQSVLGRWLGPLIERRFRTSLTRMPCSHFAGARDEAAARRPGRCRSPVH